jgi:hypothetical protein
MGVQENIAKLNDLLFFITKENRKLAKEIIALYKKRKIKRIGEVEELFRRLTNNNKQARGYVLKKLEGYTKATKKEVKMFKYHTNLILFKKIDVKDKEEVEQAKAVDKAKKGKYHKGYIQYHAGDHVLDILSLIHI